MLLKDIAYVFISLGMVRHLSDRSSVMYLGRIVESGAWQPVSDHPLHPYTMARDCPSSLRCERPQRRCHVAARRLGQPEAAHAVPGLARRQAATWAGDIVATTLRLLEP